MFLFDNQKSGNQKNSSGGNVVGVRWKTYLNTNPAYCAESTAAIDELGNFYFGSHSGCFYSLNCNGVIRWMFYTKKKIYGSPVLCNDCVLFISGDGFIYSLKQSNGQISWLADLKQGYYETSLKRIHNELFHLKYTINFKRRIWMNTKSWSSPTLVDNMIIATGFGKGLYVYDARSGKELWSKDLGFPRYQLTGVVLDPDKNIYMVTRKGDAISYTLEGQVIWQEKLLRGWSAWGNPTYDSANNQVYFTFSKGEKKGQVVALNNNGKVIWSTRLNGAIHGSVSISNSNNLYCSDFSGYLYMIDAINGNIMHTKRISNAIRALWTTPTIDSNNDIHISVKDSLNTGRIIKLDNKLNILWSYNTHKALSVPLIIENGDVCFGGWDGFYYCLQTKE